MEEGKFDGILISMLQEGKSYENFFDNLFGFLRRKTDFFSDWKKAEGIIAGSGKKHIEQFEKDKKEEQKRKEEKAKRDEAKGKTQEKKPDLDQDEILKKIQKAKEEQEKAAREAAEKKATEAVESKDGEKKEDEKESKAPPGNGGITDRYVWTQTLNEVNVTIPVDDSISKKDLNIKISHKGLYIAVKGQKIIDGDWPEKIDVGAE